jgi:GNAT superfamily N-acetyltransferase
VSDGSAPWPAGEIRPARPGDVPVIHQMISDLGAYELSLPGLALTQQPAAIGTQLPEVTPTPQDLAAALFCPEPAVFAHVAERDGRVVGYALWYLSYSTWQGRHGIYLEDLYVEPAARGHGYGRGLMAELAALCVERGYGRLEWSVLDRNAPALGFYAALGAAAMGEWIAHRLAGPALRALAADVPRDTGPHPD